MYLPSEYAEAKHMVLNDHEVKFIRSTYEFKRGHKLVVWDTKDMKYLTLISSRGDVMPTIVEKYK